MKKKISKLWGIGLVVMLLGGLFIVAAPVSAADPLTWNNEYPPSAVYNILAEGLDIYDMAINGDTVWAGGVQGTDNCSLYKSVDGGKTWVLNNDATTWLGLHHNQFQCDFIAMAPDDPNIVVVVDNNPVAAYVTTTGGAMWSDLYLDTGPATPMDADAITDLTISPSVFGTHYITVSGVAGGNAAIQFFNLGAASPSWLDAVDEGAFAANPLTDDAESFVAVEFSPNFASDYIMVAVSANNTSGVQLHVASFNSWKWNEAIGYFENYPATVAIHTAPGAVVVNAADLVLAPDYMGGDDVLRVAFVGLDATDAAVDISGIYRMSNTIGKGIMAAPAGINSVDYNGAVLVAGAYNTNITYYCADPLAITPTVLPARTYKRPGVDSTTPAEDAVIVNWYGENLLAGKRGDASAISISRDNGLTWNDISLMDSALTDINDIYVSPDGSTWYVTANDSGEASLYRFSGGWERVLCDTANQAFILRAAVDDANAVYVAEVGSTDIYFSADGGMTRWYKRSAPGNVTDLAVESKDVIYVGIGTTIRKSANQGFTWGPPMYPATGGDVTNVKALSENNVVVGTSTGFVGYTTDGGATWTKIPVPTGTNIHVTATGLEAGGCIFAAYGADDEVTRWVIGTDVTWRDMLPPETATYITTGIELSEGVLYVATANGTVYRQTWPTITNPSAIFWSDKIAAAGKVFDKTPNAIKTSSGSTKLWAISSATGTGGADEILSYVDTLAAEAPGLVSPADAALIPLNIQSGTNYAITFTWTRPSLATDYSLYIGLDPFMTQYHSASVFYNATTGGTHGPFGSSMPTLSYVVETHFTPGTTLYWAVAAGAPIPGKMSEIRSFTVQPGVAAVPTIGSPANGAKDVGVNPAFSWSPVTGATKYEFQLAVSTNFATPLYSEKLAETGIRPAVALVPGTTYFWRVRAIEPVMGDWSTIANFTVAAEEEPAPPPVEIIQTPPPVIEIPPAPPAQEIVIPPAPAAEEIAPSYIWAIIIIGAILVIAVIVLIVRTRRQV